MGILSSSLRAGASAFGCANGRYETKEFTARLPWFITHLNPQRVPTQRSERT
jgi:hypothetical protein